MNALRYLIDLISEYPYFEPNYNSLLVDTPVTLREAIMEEEKKRFFRDSYWEFAEDALRNSLRYQDTSCLRILCDADMIDFQDVLTGCTSDDAFVPSESYARPSPPIDTQEHNVVLEFMLSYLPRHVVKAMLLMWGMLPTHNRLVKVRDHQDEYDHDNMIMMVPGHAHPGSMQQMEIQMMGLYMNVLDAVLTRTVFNAIEGGEGCADGHIVSVLIRAGVQDFGWDSGQVEGRLGGGFAWEHFRIAFTERRQDREGHETDACKQVRGAFLRNMQMGDLAQAVKVMGKESEGVYQKTFERIVEDEMRMMRK